jgi:nitrogen fixation protein FixH
MHADHTPQAQTGFRLTGRMVLLILVAFFGVVIVVNLVMAYLAVNTFSGMQTQRPYESGLEFNRTLKNASIQQAQHWQVTSHHERLPDGRIGLKLSIRDAQGQPVDHLNAKVSLLSPVNALKDSVFETASQGVGEFFGIAAADAGQWDLVIEIRKEDTEVFRSVSRISLR